MILEAGAGQDSRTWRLVHGEIAAFTRTCAYDRAGYGHSDPIDHPSTAANAVDDLHTARAAAGISPPLVLVGHSLGGLIATLYADIYPDEVAGLVLVDPSFAGQTFATLSQLPQEEAARLKPTSEITAQISQCLRLARAGDRAGLLKDSCYSPPPPSAPEVLQDFARDYFSRPKFYETELSETNAILPPDGAKFSQNDQDELRASRNFGQVPMIVLTAPDPGNPAFSADSNAKSARAWQAGHEALAARSTRGRSIVVLGSGHFIQFDRPGEVIAAVRDVVDAVRTARRSAIRPHPTGGKPSLEPGVRSSPPP